MKPTPIDFDNWDRREIFEAFRTTCMYTTVQLDIANLLVSLRANGLRLYPAMVYCITSVVNSCDDYKYCYDDEGRVALWNILDAMYTVPSSGNPHLFSIAVTRYNRDFSSFYKAFEADYSRAERCGRLICDGEFPSRVAGITAMTEVNFSSFAFGDKDGKPDLTPFTVIGKYTRQDGRTLLPVCGEFAHAVNDGYHISQFFTRLEAEAEQLTTLLS